MSKIPTILLLVFASGQICASQIFGRGHGNAPPQRGGILNPNAQGGIIGGAGIGPGGRQGIFAMNGQQQQNSGKNKDRIRMGPIVFDAEHLEHDDNDDYSDENDDAYQRPHLGLDLSNLFVPIFNFIKLSSKSLEAIFCLLEKQANLLLGRSVGRGASVSTTIVIIISWLVIGLVVYALAQFAYLRRIDEEEEEERQQQLLNAAQPKLQTTPPTPQIQQKEPPVISTSVKSIWLPSVGALKLSESSILKRRESRKRRKKNPSKQQCLTADPSCQKIRHRSCQVDPETITWIESGLDRLHDDVQVRSNVLLKWNAFIRQHMLTNLSKDDLHLVRIQKSELPKLANIDVEKSDEDSLIIRVDIEATFEALLKCNNQEMSLSVTKLGTRIELKLASQDDLVHIRQTGHVAVEASLKEPQASTELLDLIKMTITNSLKNVDCDLPPLKDICYSHDDSIFVESPSSFSAPSPACSSQNLMSNTDLLRVSVIKATLNQDDNKGQDLFQPYVILEMDHPAQRQRTSICQEKEFAWPNGQFTFHISRDKTSELLVELWDSDHSGNANQESHQKSHIYDGNCCCTVEDNLSPGAVGHRFLGLGLFSVQDLVSTPSQSHTVSLQGRPFCDDSVLNWTITLKFSYVPDDQHGTSLKTKVHPTFAGVHKSLEMKQCLDNSGQPMFVTNSTYCLKDLSVTEAEEHHRLPNAVALAAVRDLQTQQSLRLGAPPATKSVLLIRAVQKIESPKLGKESTPELTTPTNCDDAGESLEKFVTQGVPDTNCGVSALPPTLVVTPEDSKKQGKGHKRKGFLATLRDRLYRKSSTPSENRKNTNSSAAEVSQDLSSSLNDISDATSSCSGRSSCCTEQSYHLSRHWKGPLSTSWQSLTSASSTLMVPTGVSLSTEDASSLSDASGISLNSSSGINTGKNRNLTALILETVEEHGFRAHYLIPKQLAKKARLRRKGVKLHVSNEHLFMSKHIKSGTLCSVCQKKIITRLGKKCYVCRDCGLTCHKGCFDKITESCSQSSLDSMELLRGSTLLKKKMI